MPSDRTLGGPVTFLERTYDETHALLLEARAYILGRRDHEQGLGLESRLRCVLETTRVTARLTSAMAWLMMQRAAFAGEVEREILRQPDNRLQGRDVCMEDDASGDETLPAELRDLARRSHAVYVRIARLDDLAEREAARRSGAPLS